MATVTNATTDANGNVIINVSSSADDAITLATAGTYSDKNIIFNMTFDTPFKPEGKSYLTFSSPESFTLKVNDTTKHWNGTLEYFAENKTWTIWDGTTALTSVNNDGEYVLYLRGTGNTIITGNNTNFKWVLTGTDVKCNGNIETLLDYATAESGNHPIMANYCYRYMFYGCTSLTQAPALPATTLVPYCYSNMFYNCTSLTQAPILPATTLEASCYYYMFYNCTSLIQAPALPATALANFCYQNMFTNCTSLIQAPALPATTLANGCYNSMFQSCTALTQVPALPATALVNYCYQNMFRGCKKIKASSIKTSEYTQEYRIPMSGDGTTATDAFTNMFTSTSGTFTGTPEINTTYYLSSDNMVVRETEIATLNGYVESIMPTKVSELTNDSKYFSTSVVYETLLQEQHLDMYLSTDADANITYVVLNTDPFTLYADQLIIGETYQVLFNGQEYTCVCWDPVGSMYEGSPILGGSENYGLTDGYNNEPFIIWSGLHIDWSTVERAPVELDIQGTDWDQVSIGIKKQSVNKLDKKFLPDETDPTVPAWAKAASKPTYTAKEVGATPASHTSDTTAHITSAERTAWNGKATKPNTIKVTLTSSGWDSAAKTQTVTATGVLADETAQLIQPTPALASQTAYYEAGILCTGQAADSLTFTATTVPTENLKVYVVIQDVVPPPVTLISFTIDGTSYRAEEGMTVGEWLSSSYNTNSYTKLYDSSGAVLTSSVINSGVVYATRPSGSSAN